MQAALSILTDLRCAGCTTKPPPYFGGGFSGVPAKGRSKPRCSGGIGNHDAPVTVFLGQKRSRRCRDDRGAVSHQGAYMKPNGILETALYVDDPTGSGAFYERVMGLSSLLQSDRLCAYDAGGQSVLLLFRKGGTTEPVETPGGVIPPHDAAGRIHFAFSVDRGVLPEWEAHLAAQGVEIEGRSDWMRGGHSLYFRDPDGHLVELAGGPGLWPGH
jgi:catechol 2,3-dioxygenase-like lactoylglutathione lyase family enzyme